MTIFRVPRDGRGCQHQGPDPLGMVRAASPTLYLRCPGDVFAPRA